MLTEIHFRSPYCSLPRPEFGYDCLTHWALIQLHTPPLPATHVEPATGLHTNQDSILESLTERDFSSH